MLIVVILLLDIHYASVACKTLDSAVPLPRKLSQFCLGYRTGGNRNFAPWGKKCNRTRSDFDVTHYDTYSETVNYSKFLA